MNDKRSPLIIRIYELVAASMAGGLAWFWLRQIIWGFRPWGWVEGYSPGPLPEWFIHDRDEILILAWPIAIIVAVSTIFLMRALDEQNICHFSRLGHSALAWPVINFLPLSIWGPFSTVCLPIGFILALVAAILSLVKKENFGSGYSFKHCLDYPWLFLL
jgi:hypothetical protein